jgi:UDP-glucose 4-epimerase
VLELIEAIGLEHELAPPRAGEIARSSLDPAAAHRALGWSARVPLADGLARTLEALGAAQAERRAASSEA